MQVEARALLPLPPERTFEVIARWEDQPRWMQDADRVEVLGTRREGVGTRVAVRTRVLGVPAYTEVLEVVGWDPPWRIVVAHRGVVRGTGAWDLRPEAGGTLLRWREDLRLPVPVAGEVLLRCYRPVMRWLMGRSLAALGRLATGGPPVPGNPWRGW
jgi:uncharacterized protein YndB with AHSA1/START domain